MNDDIILKLSVIHWGNCPWFWWCVLLGNSQNSFFHFGCWAKHFIKMPHSCYKTKTKMQNNLPPLFPVMKSVCLGLVKSHRLKKKKKKTSVFPCFMSRAVQFALCICRQSWEMAGSAAVRQIGFESHTPFTNLESSANVFFVGFFFFF